MNEANAHPVKTKLDLFLEWIQSASVVRVGGMDGGLYSHVEAGTIRGEPGNALVMLVAPPSPAHWFTESAIEKGGFKGDAYIAIDKAGTPVMIEALKLVPVPIPSGSGATPIEPETMNNAEWQERYKPIANPFAGDGKYQMFETHGEELDYVLTMKLVDPRTIWTLVDTDEGAALRSGYHSINRLSYYITKIPYEGVACEVID